MIRLVRILLLGAVAFGIVLALTTAPSSGSTRGQTGYGDDVLKPCNQVASGQQCLQSFETEVAQEAGSAKDSSGNLVKYALYGFGFVVTIGGFTYFYNAKDFGRLFRKS